jgi:hypothetical protein
MAQFLLLKILQFLVEYDRIRLEYILSSSVVEQSAVNRLAVGSSPTWGVKLNVIFYDYYY